MANEFIDDTFMDGFKDGPHVTEVQTGLANQGLYGPDDYVLEGGREAEAQILTNNSIRIFDAVYVLQGRRDVIAANDYTDVSIDNGAQGLNRNDIIVRRYTKDESSEVESTEYAVIKGTAVSGEANDPEVTEGDIRSGATLHEMKLYRVKIEGLNIVAVEPLFQVLYNMSHIKELLSELNGKTKVEEFTQSAWDDHTVRFYKIGNIVICVNTAAHAMPQANFKARYCNIPSACRPITRAYTAINEWDGHQYASTAEAMVEADGDVIYYRTSSAENRERNFTLVWLTS